MDIKIGKFCYPDIIYVYVYKENNFIDFFNHIFWYKIYFLS